MAFSTRFQNLPIRWKLTIVSAVACGASLLIASLVYFVVDYAVFRGQLANRGTVLARVVGSNSTAALAFGDSSVATNILAGLAHEQDVFFAALCNEKGEELARYRRADAPQNWEAAPVTSPGHSFQTGALYICDAVTLRGDLLGYVSIAYNLRPLQQRAMQAGLVVVLVMALSVLIGWQLSFRMQEHISSRIVKLQATAERIWREEDFTVRAKTDSVADEIGRLVGAFNEMVAYTEKRNSELRKHQGRLRAMASQLVLAEERERRRVADELHDSICQLLWVAQLKLGLLDKHCGPSGEEELGAAKELVDEAQTRARSLTHRLSPPVLYQFGLEPALAKLAERFGDEYELNVVFEDGESAKDLTEDVSVMLYRTVRELLMNAYKHAGADTVTIKTCRNDNRVRITVSDDGDGFEPDTVYKNGQSEGFGLFSIRERFVDIGASFTITSQPGQGTTATLEASLRPSEEEAPPHA